MFHYFICSESPPSGNLVDGLPLVLSNLRPVRRLNQKASPTKTYILNSVLRFLRFRGPKCLMNVRFYKRDFAPACIFSLATQPGRRPALARNFYCCIPWHLRSPGTFLCAFIYFYCCVPGFSAEGDFFFLCNRCSCSSKIE